ncbi:PASTA domain-containing protein [Streptomyces sp. NPDC047061]|uniref:PASTA domain-containing protein n=1 Tax=Streptomyces sp. NPDC047061 TaxID=3154605 RepID=UPI0033ED74C3
MFGRGAADGGKAAVLDLVGQNLEGVGHMAGNVDLGITVDKRESCADQPKGRICTQSPTDGELAKGEAVEVIVSTGAPKVV